jgi:hypothetical protein
METGKRDSNANSFLDTLTAVCSAFYPDFLVGGTANPDLEEISSPTWIYDPEKDMYFFLFGPNNSPGQRAFPAVYNKTSYGAVLKETQAETLYTIVQMPYWVSVNAQSANEITLSRKDYDYLKEVNPDLTFLIGVYYYPELQNADNGAVADEHWHAKELLITNTDLASVAVTLTVDSEDDFRYLGFLPEKLESYNETYRIPYPAKETSLRPHSLHSIRPLKALLTSAIGNFEAPAKRPWQYMHPYPWPLELIEIETETNDNGDEVPIVSQNGWTTSKDLTTLFSYSVQNKTWYFGGSILFLTARSKSVRSELGNCFQRSRNTMRLKITSSNPTTYQTHIAVVDRSTLGVGP